ncbi:enoyl-CoA hydratase [Bryobacterales bacterium F-183]|nr:enoyl-CoA hydratase [Bryobacterales bacterium F-183]
MNVLRNVEDSIAVLTLDRPERRNALSLELMREMLGHLDAIAADVSIRVVILRAAGKVFCSGHDLSEMTGRTLNEYREIFDVCAQMMERIQSIPQPVIAEVQGIATAAGCQLVCTCDLAVASDAAGFATPGVRIGLFCTTPMVALTRTVGRKRAMEMLLTGRMVPAAEAAEWGIVNRVVAAEALAEETMRLAREIVAASGLVVGLGKDAFYRQIELEQAGAYGMAKDVMSMNALAGDAQEGIGAFLEKRKPCWKGQ